MSNDIRDEFFINYYINNRAMRKIHNPDLLHQAYASKYANWIVPFLKQHHITDVPLLLCCNTLYQLPDFFTLGKNSFFVSDYYLHSFFYDLNYSLSNRTREEFVINLFIKTFIETSFLAGNIDLSYSLAQTTPDIEIYKKTDEYRDSSTMEQLIDKTDLQEAFTLLHEATHYLCSKDEQKIHRLTHYMPCFKMIANLSLNPKIIEECYCDFKSVTYILQMTYGLDKWSKDEYFRILFLTLIYIYTLQYTRESKNIDTGKYSSYMDQEMNLFWIRFGCMHSNISNYLTVAGNKNDITTLNSTYQKCTELFIKIGQKVRTILEYTKCEGNGNLRLFKNISQTQKVDYIKSYLNLLS